MTIRIDAAPTFRDLGGIAIGSGGRVRNGRVFRAGSLLEPTARDRETLRRLGIRTVFDLRSRTEREMHPSAWGDACGARVVDCDVNRDIRTGSRDLLELLHAQPSEAGARVMMRETYRGFGHAFSSQLASMFETILSESALPVLIHCTAGKDRTGFACAMLLHALGADEQTVTTDYLRTAEFVQHDTILQATVQMLAAYLGKTPDADVVRTLAGVCGEYLQAALDGLRRDFGSVDRYLEEVARLDAGRRERLRSVLLED